MQEGMQQKNMTVYVCKYIQSYIFILPYLHTGVLYLGDPYSEAVGVVY